MRLSQRIRQLQAAEVVEVVEKLVAAREALEAAEAKQQAYFGKDTKPHDWLGGGKKKEPEKRDDVASWNLRELRRAFEPMDEAVEAWLRDGSDQFFPAVVAWDDGDASLTEGFADLVKQRQTLAAALEATLPELRTQLLVVAPVRVAVHRLVSAVEAQQRVEDVEVMPAVLSGDRNTTSQATGRRAERYKTSDDVARSLRMARPSELERGPPPEPEPEGLFASLKKKFFG